MSFSNLAPYRGTFILRGRSARVERTLVDWGRDLYRAALPAEHTANVPQAWARIDSRAGRQQLDLLAELEKKP